MKKVITKAWPITALLIMLGLFTCQAQSKKIIAWERDVLQPSSFTIIPDNANTGRATANTVSKFQYYFQSKPAAGGSILVEFSVQNIFSSDDSWMKTGVQNDYKLLQHEQAHFDLSEVYARKIVKAVSDAKISQNLKTELRSITQELSAELVKQQDLYDEQTEHGVKSDEQEKWRSFIDQELEKYAKYESKSVIYTVKIKK